MYRVNLISETILSWSAKIEVHVIVILASTALVRLAKGLVTSQFNI